MFSIKVSSNIAKLTDKINAAKPQIELAIVRSLNKIALWVKSQASREISQEKQVKLKLIRKRLQIIKANRNSLRALVRASLFGIKAAKLRSMRQTRTGAVVGKYMFQSAFVATMPRGYTSVFKRKGKTALPIQEVTLPLEPEGSRIIRGLVSDEVEKVFEKYFEHELNFILQKV